jgi:RNA polymerase sigma-70 factor, ECF subfamily
MVSDAEAQARRRDGSPAVTGAGVLASDEEFLDETRRWMGDEAQSIGELLPRVYDELRAVAGNFLRHERADHTLQPTALVHEAYLRLVDQRSIDWSNRPQFMAVAARMMRRILVTHATARKTEKRGADRPRVQLDLALDVLEERNVSAIEVNRALGELEEIDPRQAQIAELRFFGGMTFEETAEVLGISSRSVKREWVVAKRWLGRQLRNAA